MTDLEKDLLEATRNLPEASNNEKEEAKVDENISSNNVSEKSNIIEVNGVMVNSETCEVIKKDTMQDLIDGTYNGPLNVGIPEDTFLKDSLNEFLERSQKEIEIGKDYLGIITSVSHSFKKFQTIIISFEVNGLIYEDSFPIRGGEHESFYIKKLMKFLFDGGIVLTDLDFSDIINLSTSLDTLLKGSKIIVHTYKNAAGNLRFNNALISKYDAVNKVMLG